MKMPSFGQLRSAVFFFFIFFTIMGIAQFYFVKGQSERVTKEKLRLMAQDLNRDVIAYNKGVDFESYDKAANLAEQYYFVLNTGLIIDFYPAKNGIPAELIPRVKCPALPNNIDANPQMLPPYTFIGVSKKPEKWWLCAKHLDKGNVIVGISEHEEQDQSQRRRTLEKNMAYFIRSTLESAKAISQNKFDNSVSWALIDDRGFLVNGAGRIPLKVLTPSDNWQSSSQLQFRTLGNQYVLYFPITDSSSGQTVGTMIIPEDISGRRLMLGKLKTFGVLTAIFSFITFAILVIIYRKRHEEEKRLVREAFQNYFSPQIMKEILKNPGQLKLGGQRKEVTVLFSDIRSFTALSEKLAPDKLTSLLQEYFNAMTEAVFATDGVVDKYIGDAIMAFWGAPIEQPDQADRAVRTAIDMMNRLSRLRTKWISEGYPSIDIGIGINSGLALIGNFGSTKRFDYTVMGDVVNAASRLESLNKEFKSNILISGAVKTKISMTIETRDLNDIKLRGKEKEIRVFEVIV